MEAEATDAQLGNVSNPFISVAVPSNEPSFQVLGKQEDIHGIWDLLATYNSFSTAQFNSSCPNIF